MPVKMFVKHTVKPKNKTPKVIIKRKIEYLITADANGAPHFTKTIKFRKINVNGSKSG